MFIQRWLRFCFFNLLIVAILGILLRYKIAFSLPFVDQKYVLHSHSHFAFTGWITQTLLVLLVQYLYEHNLIKSFLKYRHLLLLNLISAYGMLVSFLLQGYGFYSISFSTLSIIVAFIFAFQYWKDLRIIPNPGITHHWFKAALVFNLMSSVGAVSLAIVMALKLTSLKIYLSSVFYFLHFQYNGWFFFVCMGLFFYHSGLNQNKLAKIIFWLFAAACIPAYFLSALWAAIHPLLYWLVVLAALSQTAGWVIFFKLMFRYKDDLKNKFTITGKRLLFLSGFACSIKISLQLLSVIPYLSKLAFGYRPIVIGYLHLVLLGVISLFLIGYILSSQYIKISKFTNWGIAIFVAGIFSNELILMTQGIAAIAGIWIPFTNEYLLIAALMLFTGMVVLNLSLKQPIQIRYGRKKQVNK